MATFPTTLPKPLMDTFEVSSTDPWVDDPSEVGSARRRKRFTRALKSFGFILRMSDAQKDTLKSFYETTLDDGVDSFTWTNPEDSTAYTVRFQSKPIIRAVAYNIWDAEVSLTEQ